MAVGARHAKNELVIMHLNTEIGAADCQPLIYNGEGDVRVTAR